MRAKDPSVRHPFEARSWRLFTTRAIILRCRLRESARHATPSRACAAGARRPPIPTITRGFAMTDPAGYTWEFFRAGDFEQVALGSGRDLMALDRLDQKLWAALACPVQGLHFDKRTLEL